MKKTVAVICSTLYSLNAILHLLLLLGFPLGEYVLGGYYKVMPIELRFINLIFMLLWTFSSYTYLVYGTIISSNLNIKTARKIIIAFTTFTTIAIFSSLLLTTSPKEKYLMTPFTLLVSTLSYYLLKSKN